MNKLDANKKRLTLRVDSQINREIEAKAKELGLTKNGYISMILHQEFKKKSRK